MTPRIWSYGDEDSEDVPIRDQPYERYGQQGFAMPDHATRGPVPAHALERVSLGEQVAGPGRGPRHWRRRDERIHDDVCRLLTDDGWVDASDLEVVVQEGEVTLTGTVADRRQRERALDIAESVRGVVDVMSRIRLR